MQAPAPEKRRMQEPEHRHEDWSREKRPCRDERAGEGGAPSDFGRAVAARQRELAVAQAADAVVKGLKGCPSLLEATRRSSQIVSQFHNAISDAATRDAEAKLQAQAEEEEEEPQAERESSMRHANRVLWRAVRFLSARCRLLEAETAGAERLPQALAACQEHIREAASQNALLQEQVRMSMDGPGSVCGDARMVL